MQKKIVKLEKLEEVTTLTYGESYGIFGGNQKVPQMCLKTLWRENSRLFLSVEQLSKLATGLDCPIQNKNRLTRCVIF